MKAHPYDVLTARVRLEGSACALRGGKPSENPYHPFDGPEFHERLGMEIRAAWFDGFDDIKRRQRDERKLGIGDVLLCAAGLAMLVFLLYLPIQ